MKNNFFRKWLALSALFAFMCFSPHMLLRAQSTANYAFSTNTAGSLGLDMNGNVVDMTAGTTQVLTTNTSQDQAINATVITFPAGFEFYMAGNRFTSYFATSNGLVQLGATAVIGGGTYTAGGGTLAAPRITAFDGDLGTGTTGGIFGKLIGTGPNRCYVIEFRNMSLMWTNAYPNNGTYQVRFYEGTGVIEFVYGTMNCGSTTSAGDATPEIGFSWGTGANQSASLNIATSALDLSGTMTQNTITAGAIPNLNSAAEGSRRVYRFTPPAIPVAPTALTFAPVGSTTMTLNWVDNSTTEFSYTVSRSLDGVTYTNVATLPANTTSYPASGLAPNTLYYWNVTATSESGTSTPVLAGSQSTTSPTLSGIKTVGAGGDYQNLTTAFADINSQALSGNVELQLITGYPAAPETYPIVSSNAIATGAFTIKVYPTVSGLSITSANTAGTLNLNNAVNLTFDGRVNQAGANDLVIANTNAGTSYAVQFINDARNNTLTNVILRSANTSTSSGTIVFGTTIGTNGNDNNTITNCDIMDGATTPTNAIYSVGTTTSATHFNDNNTISNNAISNFFSAGSSSIGVYVGTGNSGWTISNNKLFQTATRTYTSGNTHNGIQVANTNGNGFVITGNVIGYASAAATGVYTIAGAVTNRFIGINLSVGTTTASSVQGNTIAAINLTSTSGAGTGNGILAGINITNGNVNVGNTTPNIIGAATGTGSITASSSSTGGLIVGINSSSSGTVNVSGNTIGSITALGSAATVSTCVTGIQVSSGTATVNSNVIGSTTTANSINSSTVATSGSQLIRGIDVSASGGAISIQSNTIANMNQSATTTGSSIRGIMYSGTTVATISQNMVYNLSGANANTTPGATGVTGILHSGSATGGASITGNTIYALSATNNGTVQTNVSGILYTGPTAGSITKNKIYDLRNASTMATATTPPTAAGIVLRTLTTSVNVNNNMIALGDAQTTNTEFIGIWNNVNAGAALNIYHNSVSISGTAGSGALPSFGFLRGDNTTTAVTSTVDIRNNIFSNTRTGGTGKQYAIGNQGSTASATGWGLNASNYNVLNAGAATIGLWGPADQTFNGWRTAAASDANSSSGIAVTFTDVTTGNLHLNMGVTPTAIESGGVAIASVTTDFDNEGRPGPAGSVNGGGSAPDLGADEFDGVPAIPVITLNSVTPPATVQCAATARVVSVDVNPSAGTTATVTLGYAVNGVAQTGIVMTNSAGSTWTGTIPAATPGNATITWGVTAVNSLGITGTYVGTAYSDEPLFGATATATASVNTICVGGTSTLTAALSKTGSVTVGNATTTTGAVEELTAFCNRRSSYKMQTLYTAAELNAAGLFAGPITSMAFNIATNGDATTNASFIVKIGTSALTTLTDYVASGSFTTVFPSATYTHAVGQNVINFSTPYNWDGTSNIVIEVTHNGINSINNAQTFYTTTAGNMVAYGYNGATTATMSNKRFNVVFVGNNAPSIQAISWSDGVGTAGTTNPLTVSPTATTTYTATITAAGCTVAPAPTTTVTVNPLPSTPTAVNSAQCGVQTPTAHVTSTSGLPTPSFNWYAASTGGPALQSSTSTTYTSTVAVTTTFYVSELNSVTGCESARVPVTITVSTPDQVSLTASVASVCVGGTFTLTAANTNPTPFQSYTYSVESATTGSGAETPLAGNPVSVTPTAAGTFTYTVTGVDGGCAASATASVLVNPLPAVTATATPATVCSGDNIALVAGVTTANDGPFAVGAGALIGSGDYYSPFYHLFGGVKSQYIIRASELTAAGLTAGNLTSVALNIGTVGSPYAGFTIHVGTTAATDLSAGLNAATLTPVYSNASLVLTAAGLNTFNFSTPIFWNGTSNLIVQLSWSNNNGGGTSSEIQYDNMAYVATAYYRADNQTPATVLAGTPATGTRSTRPKMTFKMNHNNNYTWSWAPGTGLNTPSATTSITNSSGSAVTQVFTVTTTNSVTGCVATTPTSAVTINTAVPAPVANNSAQCGTGTPTASVTGTGTLGNTFSWYLVSTGGTAITGQTGSSLTGYPVTATTTFYVSENSAAGCMSPRTPVTVTVTAAPAITVSGTATICQGSSTSLTASSANTGYTYSWSGGLGTGATVSASPTTGTTYTVTGTDMSGGANNGCVNTATYVITVNPAPATAPVVPATATICAGDLQHLTSGPTTSTAIYGNGTTAPSTTSYPNPLSAYYGGVKHQILFTAAELTAQGLVPGSQISTVTFDVNAFAANACTNFTIRMGNTAVTALTGFVAGTTTVYGPTTYTPSATGLVTFTLSAPYTWNGTSNIVVETVHNAGNGGNGSGTRTNTTTTLANTVYYGASDNVAGGIAGFDALTTWDLSAASNLRPNVRFLYTGAGPVWSPSASLYTDAAGTVAYTGTGASSVYAKPTTTTTYVVTYTGSNGCTAQSSATITVNQPTSSSVAPVTACGSYTWAQTGMTYTTSGVYRDTIPNAVGCDSVISLTLTINQPSASTVTQVACQTYTWAQNGMTYNVSGSYNDTIPNAAGCDSVVTLNLTIGAPNASLFPMTACGSYVWPQTGLTYTVSGAYNDTLTNIYGCDSVVTLSLTINQPTGSTVAPVTACTSYTWSQTGMTYNVSGTYTDTLTNAVGCDSIITLNLTIIQPTTSSVSATACTSYTWAQNGMTYNTSGAYTDTIPNAAGCDSIITLNLTINNATTSVVTVSTCNPTYTWAQNGTVYTASGSYIDTIQNAAGCDSIVTLNLTITPFVATATVNANATVTASAGTSYQWINCATNTPVAGATAQTFAPTANGSYAVIVSNGTCSDTSNCVNVTNVGIKEGAITTISVHPNPTHDVVTVTMDAPSATVEVMDVQGKLVQTTQIKSGGQIDLSAYERGVYTLRVKTEYGTAIERIVKN